MFVAQGQKLRMMRDHAEAVAAITSQWSHCMDDVCRVKAGRNISTSVRVPFGFAERVRLDESYGSPVDS